MHNAKTYDVALCGGGIGGLTAAIALSQKGLNCVVVERMSTASAHGSGIQLGPNAYHVLSDLGMVTSLKNTISMPEFIHVRDIGSGRTISKIPLGKSVYKKYLAPYSVIHRKDLHDVLIKKILDIPQIEYVSDFPAERFEEYEESVDIISTRGQSYNAKALIGCDGLWSIVRKQLHGDELPVNSGQIAWRATIPTSKLDKNWHQIITGLWLGKNKHIVTYPIKGGSYINLVAITKGKAPGIGWSEEADKNELLDIFSNANDEITKLIKAIPTLHLWQLHDREPLGQWGKGRVSLLGDAAHPQLPHLAQGAAMAIEDAHVLARCLENNTNDVRTALQLYEGLRRDRTKRVQQTSRSQVKNYQMGKTTGSLRNLVMKMTSQFMPEKLLEHYDWLYGANVVRKPNGSEV